MRLTIEVTEGPLAGQKSELSEGQVAIVGRADRSDFAIPHDRYLSGRHMLVECTQVGCHLRDLNSTNGTWLNGTRVVDAELLDGDMVLAGRTVIRVSIQDHRDRENRDPQPVTMRTVNQASRSAEPEASEKGQSSIRDRIKKSDFPPLDDDESTDRFPSDAIPLTNPPTEFSPSRTPDGISSP